MATFNPGKSLWANFMTFYEELKKSVSDGKTLVANAITAKGVETATDATFQTMADNIALIEQGAKETKIAKFTTSTTWTIPEGVTSIDVCCVGGGQGSGGSGTGGGASQGGRGGDGGKVYYKTGISVTPGTSYAITVGAGGAGLAATSTSLTYQKAGSDGGNSTFGSLVSSASATTRKSGGQGWAAGGTSSGTINSTAVAGTNGVYAFNDVTVDGILYGGSGAGGTSGSSVLSGGESGGGNSSTAGTSNTGGGAGGRNYRNGSTYAGFSGGSGIVIVRYQI